MKKSLSLILVLVMLFGMLPRFILPAGAVETETITNTLEGKTISILGDSISTYTGVSNDASCNTSLSGAAIWYTPGRQNVYQADTWWQQTIDALGLELVVNNSWSGSCIFNTRSGTAGAYIDRCVQLHNTEGTEPDIIAVYLGTNDFCNFKSTLGTAADIDYEALISETESGYTYATPATAAEAYAIMLHKAMVRYPDAEVYCFTLLPQRLSAGNVVLLEQFNKTLLEIAEHFGAYGVDLYHNSGIKYDANFSTYVTDNNLHPGPLGMDAITGCFLSAIYENSRYISGESHSITYDLEDVIVDQGTAYAMVDGGVFSCTLTAPAGYDLVVTVTMGGADITASSYANGKISISSVSDDVLITASASIAYKEAQNYRWEFNGSELVNIVGSDLEANALTRLEGSVTDGVHTKSRYQLGEAIVLYHDRPWAVEWKSEGSWVGSGSGALLFSNTETNSALGNIYFYRRQNDGLFALGYRGNNAYHNYGVVMSEHNVDCSALHTYRLENRIAEDGTNMVYLLVDGTELGPMVQYSVDGAPPTSTGN